MREIKFRYKVEGRKKLLYDTDDEFGYLQRKREMIAGSMGELFIVEKEMQFTGFKDKNGKEIYDGDSVECFLKEVGIWVKCKVIYDDIFGLFRLLGMEDTFYEKSIEFRNVKEVYREVIGNSNGLG